MSEPNDDAKKENDSDSDSSSLSSHHSSSAPRPSPSFIPSVAKLLDDGRYDCYPEDAEKVVKTIVKSGDGNEPEVGCKVVVHYVGTLLDGKKFDSSRDRGEPFSFKLGVGQVIKGWDYGVSSMKVGEIADFTIKPDYAYGDNGSPPSIPPKATLRFNVELISFEKEPVTASEKIAFGTLRKDEGNAFVKEQKWLEALKSYDRGIAYVQYLYTKNEELMKKKKELHEQLQSNKALCCIKLNKIGEGLIACDEILREDKTHTKALFRRALLFEKRGDYVRAKADLLEAAQHNPNDGAIRTELEKVNAHLKEIELKEKKKFSNMFGKLKAIEEQEAADKKRRELEEKTRLAGEKKKAQEKEAEKKLAEEKKKEKEKEAEKKLGEEKEKEKEKETVTAETDTIVKESEEGKEVGEKVKDVEEEKK